jgi:hypothetical protein
MCTKIKITHGPNVNELNGGMEKLNSKDLNITALPITAM